jgi:formylglycine-generating enzyme required for sulfatase activity
MWMKCGAVLVCWLLAAGAAGGADPVVSNVQARQLPRSKQVEITYDLADTEGDNLYVSVAVSADGGKIFAVPARDFRGDVGAVLPGTGKRIVWEARVDLEGVYGATYQVAVIASDNRTGVTAVFPLPEGAALEMVRIPPGQFTMGSPLSELGRHGDEGPQHPVVFTRGFYLGKYELTQGQWHAVTGRNPSQFKGPRRPVEQVSWYDVQGFVHRLNQAAGDSLYWLPTEAEWEYACRAGTATRWSFGDEESHLGEYAWYEGNNNPNGTKEVGRLKPNPWGLHDMHGNVWEWCQDRYRYYSSGAQTDPAGPSTGSYPSRVRRGGVFQSDTQYTRSAERSSYPPDSRDYVLGARLARKAESWEGRSDRFTLRADYGWPVEADPMVSNVRARQLPGSRQVEITYDLADEDEDTLYVSVAVSADGGKSFAVPARIFSGDVGAMLPGPGKRVVWEAGVDLREAYGENYQAKVVASNVKTMTVYLPGGAMMEMVWIKPGIFTMGSPSSEPGRQDDEGPQHQVTISQGFWLGKYEITQRQWQSVMGANPSSSNSANRPVVGIDYYEVNKFIGRLNQAYGAAVYRLPTEAEWEYACRAGTATPWSFGDDESWLGEYAWYAANNRPGGTKEVGQRMPNPWGLYDMHGNVWEWCQDWYDDRYYSSEAQTDPRGASANVSPVRRIRRGGDFRYGAEFTRSAERGYCRPNVATDTMGARLLRIR